MLVPQAWGALAMSLDERSQDDSHCRGAYNGYWAALVRKQCVKSLTSSWAIDAIDIAPPSRSWNFKARVRFGGAEALRGHNARTLLLCMPSPGEQSLADDALTCFGGEYVAYVGEWGR